MKSMLKRAMVVGGFVFTAAGAGCNSMPTLQGKVIQGNLSFVAVVDSGDERLKSDGLAGAQVVVRGDPRRGSVVVAESETDSKGSFTLRFKDQSVFLRPAEFGADKAGFRPARGEMSLPPSDRRLLIILAPLGVSGSATDGPGSKPGTK
jgi:hypothetical protein